jgi:hypothetical protein
VVSFRTLYNYIERESNRRESCRPNQCHSAELEGKEVRDDRLFLGVPFLDDTRLGWGCSTRSCSSSSWRGVEFAIWNGSEFISRNRVGVAVRWIPKLRD